MKRFKVVVEKDGKHVVVNAPKSFYGLIKQLLKSPQKGIRWEWLFSYESPLAQALWGKERVEQQVYGASVKEFGLIHIFIDKIAKEFAFLDSGDIVEWLSEAFNHVALHELIHCLEPNLTEEQVEWAVLKMEMGK